jgi:hypothetical protein
MVGSRGRSGGTNKKIALGAGDGPPVSPRALSPRAAALFSWLLDKLRCDDAGSQWSRIDGTVLAALSELLESSEHVASQLADSPGDLGLLRIRIQIAAQITRMSAVIGMCPIDRKRQPQSVPVDGKEDAFESIMRRMAAG